MCSIAGFVQLSGVELYSLPLLHSVWYWSDRHDSKPASGPERDAEISDNLDYYLHLVSLHLTL